MSDNTLIRMGVFAKLAEISGVPFGRTALMKLCYLLQQIRKVPLGYNFSLYSYGPFDSEVLADLQTAQDLRILDSQVEQYSNGYSYQISESNNSGKVKTVAAEFLTKYSDDIIWTANNFSRKSASELELISTIIYVSAEKRGSDAASLAALVKAIKPRFSQEEILGKISNLHAMGLVSEMKIG